MAVNPNFPVVDYAVCWAVGPTFSPQQTLWCSLTERSQGKFSWRRGKQYELDQVQPGEAYLTVRNLDGALDPANTASPYNGYVIPYRLFRARAQWPATPNLLTRTQYAQAGWNFQANIGTYQIASYSNWSVAGGVTYSGQFTVSCTVNLGVQASLYWYNTAGAMFASVGGAVVTATSTPGVVSVTGTAPAGAVGAALVLASTTNPSVGGSFTYSSAQVEKAAAPSTPTQPGIWYNLFTGYVERWPQAWSSAGNYGTMDLTIVDLFAYYANQAMNAPFIADMLALGPNFFYPLNEASGTVSFNDASVKRGNITVNAASVVGAFTAGASVSSGDNSPRTDKNALTGAFLGTPGPVVSITPGPVNAGNVSQNGGALNVPGANGVVGTPPTGAWMRVIAAQCPAFPPTTTPTPALWFLTEPTGLNGFGVVMDQDSSSGTYGKMKFTLAGGGNAASVTANMPLITQTSTGATSDPDWHLFAFGYDPSTKTLSFGVDGIPFSTVVAGVDVTPQAVLGYADIIGASLTNGALIESWPGDVALAAEFPFVLTWTQFANLNQSWRNAWAYSAANTGETSNARYQRILGWTGYTGPTRLSAGVCTKMGPASDITGLAVLQALQNVVDTENGQHFIGADGVPVFQSRADRYDHAPVVTLGENTGAGEWPYKDALVDYDPTRIANDIQVTQQFGNALYRQTDGPQTNPATSQGKYGTITLQRTSNAMDPNELTAAASWLLYQNKDPLLRFEQLPLNPSANSGMFPSLLGLELGACVAVNRRPANVPQISMTGFVEEIDGEINGDLPAFSVTLQVSNNSKKAVWKIEDPTYGHFDQYPVAY